MIIKFRNFSVIVELGRTFFSQFPTYPLGPRRVGPGLRCELDPRVGFRRANVKNPS